jgi:ABC-2 type transport system ATP-binding protein/lipopolysaccharide transport system ATP-binding protein
MSAVAIEFRDVAKSFGRLTGRELLFKSILRAFTSTPENRFYALKNVSFTLRRGESLAVVGRNGAGKSTLLSLVAGLSMPDSGEITANGRIAALLELGSGFHFDLTGAENLRLNASLVGLSRQRTRELYDAIVDFAELGGFMNQPLRTYSTGMVMRLAFSVAINMDPDILLIDEVLAVGDQRFQQKSFDKILDFRRRGKTILCVSHSSGMIEHLCDRAIWLDQGELVMGGGLAEVLDAYEGRTPREIPRG